MGRNRGDHGARSVDGLATGSELQVLRASKNVGAVHVTTVFRDHARASVTAGTQLPSLPDIYPRGILIGRVTSVYQNNVDEFKHIQVNPFADFSSLDSVAILVPLDRK